MENPEEAGEKKIEWGEKGVLGLLVTGATVASFLGSNLYVAGLSSVLHQSIATYFDILDYVQVTPAWLVPAVLQYAIILVYFGVWALLGWTQIRSGPKADKLMVVARFIVLRSGFLPLFIVGFSAFQLLKTPRDLLSLILAWRVALTFGISSLVISFSYCLVTMKASDRRRQSSKLLKTLLAFSALVPGALCFAFLQGALVTPAWIRMSPKTTVYLSEGEEGKLTGRVVFRLAHSLILLNESHDHPLVVIPVDKIEKIETPRTRYTSGGVTYSNATN